MTSPLNPPGTIGWNIALQRFQMIKWGIRASDWFIVDTPLQELSRLCDPPPPPSTDLLLYLHKLRKLPATALEVTWVWNLQEVALAVADTLDGALARLKVEEGREFISAFKDGSLVAFSSTGAEIEQEQWILADVREGPVWLSLDGPFDGASLFVGTDAFNAWVSTYPTFDPENPSTPSHKWAVRLLERLESLDRITPEEVTALFQRWALRRPALALSASSAGIGGSPEGRRRDRSLGPEGQAIYGWFVEKYRQIGDHEVNLAKGQGTWGALAKRIEAENPKRLMITDAHLIQFVRTMVARGILTGKPKLS